MKRSALLVALSLVLILGSGVALSPYRMLAQGTGPNGGLKPQAPLGTAFTYQGYLADGNGAVNDTCDFQFSLWDAASNGTQVGSTQTKTGVTVAEGYFTVTDLDFGAAAFTGEARYLQIEVQCSGDSDYVPLDSGRVALEAAPYALYARTAPWSGLSGVPAGFADGVDDDTLGGLGCANGQIAEWNSTTSQWECGDDDTGTSGSFWSLTGNSGTNPSTNFLGTTDNVSLTLAVNGAAALRLDPDLTSPNLIGGYSGNSVGSLTYGATIGGGGQSSEINQVTRAYGVVGGGRGNTADYDATVSGGRKNTASGYASTVGGGQFNVASGEGAVVAGGGRLAGVTGAGNTASGDWSVIGGGWDNQATVTGTVIGGGYSNLVTATYGTIAGGYNITVTGQYAAVGGGWYNTASGYASTVGGGGDNTASSYNATVGGGTGNTASELYATVGGGWDNTASGVEATVGGGAGNTASGHYATVGGGNGNTASDHYATVGGGGDNTASGNGHRRL